MTKIYDGGHEQTVALSNVTLGIESSEIFSLLGRNGAGKTTFVKIASTIALPSGGHLWVQGRDVVEEADEVRKMVAVMPQEARPMDLITPWEHVYGYLLMRGMGREDAKRRTRDVIEILELEEWAGKPAFKLSGGLKQRVLVAMALATDAKILFLDEPTLGLDPLARRKVWAAINDVKKMGRTILLTTHYLDEADQLSDRLAVLDRGRVMAVGSPDYIKSLVKADLRVDVGRGLSAEEGASYGRVIQTGGSLAVLANRAPAEELAALCLKKGVSISVRPISLEDAFLILAGESTGEESN